MHSGIGQSFAQMELKVILVLLLQRLRLEFVPGQKLDAEGFPVMTFIVTQSNKYPMLVRVQKRERKSVD